MDRGSCPPEPLLKVDRVGQVFGDVSATNLNDGLNPLIRKAGHALRQNGSKISQCFSAIDREPWHPAAA
jgi:hypothetical protein